jgi:hypothetical protein
MGFIVFGHFLSVTFSSGGTRKSFARIFILILSVLKAAWVSTDYFFLSAFGAFCPAFSNS